MKANMALIDRVVRVALAVLVGVLYFMGQISGILAIVLGVVAIVFLATSLINFCPLYAVLGFSTKSKEG